MHVNTSGLCSKALALAGGNAPPLSNSLPQTLVCFSDGAHQIQRHGLLLHPSLRNEVLMEFLDALPRLWQHGLSEHDSASVVPLTTPAQRWIAPFMIRPPSFAMPLMAGA